MNRIKGPAMFAAFVAALVLVASLHRAAIGQTFTPDPTKYSVFRLTDGSALITSPAAGQFPAALVNGVFNVAQPLTAVTNVSTANAAVTLTLPAAGASLFHYVMSVTATRTCTTAITGSAVLTYTSTNLPGTLNWTAGNACAVGSTNQDIWNDFTFPLKASAANTATTIVAPAAGATGIVRLTAYYYTAP